VKFKNGRVAEWSDYGGTLRVTMGARVSNAPPFGRGDFPERVVAAMGTPSSFSRWEFLGEEVWRYGLSTVTFRQGRVLAWRDLGDLTGGCVPLAVYNGVEEALPFSDESVWVLTSPFAPSSSPDSLSPLVAENGSYYGEISEGSGRPKTVYVRGYYRGDGTYVRSHYRSSPRR
jgi:hypothetical protein